MNDQLQSALIGRKVLVRTYSAGVHAGELVAKAGKEVALKGAVRVWYWKGAFTLNEIADTGVKKGSRIGVPVEAVELTEAIEVIQMTDDAFATLEAHVDRAAA
jgi:hypothetical protein